MGLRDKQREPPNPSCARCGADASDVTWGLQLCPTCSSAWFHDAPKTQLNREDSGSLEERIEAASKRWEAWTAEWVKRGAKAGAV